MGQKIEEPTSWGKERRSVERIRGGVSDGERELLEKLLTANTMTEACGLLNIPVASGSQRLLRLKVRYARAKGVVDEYQYYRLKLVKQGKRWLE